MLDKDGDSHLLASALKSLGLCMGVTVPIERE